VGGGKVGSFLSRELMDAGYAVTVIERDAGVAARIAEEDHAALVIEADGTDPDVLDSAGAARSDWVLAVTGADEVNLVACELGNSLGAANVLARLNNPLNHATFDALGIPVVAVTDMMVRVISREVEFPELQRIAMLGDGELSLIEVEIPAGSAPILIPELRLPPQTVLVGVVSGDAVMVPGASTLLKPGDRVAAVTTLGQEDEVRALLCDRRG